MDMSFDNIFFYYIEDSIKPIFIYHYKISQESPFLSGIPNRRFGPIQNFAKYFRKKQYKYLLGQYNLILNLSA